MQISHSFFLDVYLSFLTISWDKSSWKWDIIWSRLMTPAAGSCVKGRRPFLCILLSYHVKFDAIIYSKLIY